MACNHKSISESSIHVDSKTKRLFSFEESDDKEKPIVKTNHIPPAIQESETFDPTEYWEAINDRDKRIEFLYNENERLVIEKTEQIKKNEQLFLESENMKTKIKELDNEYAESCQNYEKRIAKLELMIFEIKDKLEKSTKLLENFEESNKILENLVRECKNEGANFSEETVDFQINLEKNYEQMTLIENATSKIYKDSIDSIKESYEQKISDIKKSYEEKISINIEKSKHNEQEDLHKELEMYREINEQFLQEKNLLEEKTKGLGYGSIEEALEQNKLLWEEINGLRKNQETYKNENELLHHELDASIEKLEKRENEIKEILEKKIQSEKNNEMIKLDYEDKFTNLVEEKDNKIKELSIKINEIQQSKNKENSILVNELSLKNKEYLKEISEKDNKINELSLKLNELQEKILEISKIHEKNLSELSKKNEKDTLINDISLKNKEYLIKISEDDNKINELSLKLGKIQVELTEMSKIQENNFSELSKKNEKDTLIKDLSSQNKEKEILINDFSSKNKELQNKISEMETLLQKNTNILNSIQKKYEESLEKIHKDSDSMKKMLQQLKEAEKYSKEYLQEINQIKFNKSKNMKVLSEIMFQLNILKNKFLDTKLFVKKSQKDILNSLGKKIDANISNNFKNDFQERMKKKGKFEKKDMETKDFLNASRILTTMESDIEYPKQSITTEQRAWNFLVNYDKKTDKNPLLVKAFLSEIDSSQKNEYIKKKESTKFEKSEESPNPQKKNEEKINKDLKELKENFTALQTEHIQIAEIVDENLKSGVGSSYKAKNEFVLFNYFEKLFDRLTLSLQKENEIKSMIQSLDEKFHQSFKEKYPQNMEIEKLQSKNMRLLQELQEKCEAMIILENEKNEYKKNCKELQIQLDFKKLHDKFIKESNEVINPKTSVHVSEIYQKYLKGKPTTMNPKRAEIPAKNLSFTPRTPQNNENTLNKTVTKIIWDHHQKTKPGKQTPLNTSQKESP